MNRKDSNHASTRRKVRQRLQGDTDTDNPLLYSHGCYPSKLKAEGTPNMSPARPKLSSFVSATAVTVTLSFNFRKFPSVGVSSHFFRSGYRYPDSFI